MAPWGDTGDDPETPPRPRHLSFGDVKPEDVLRVESRQTMVGGEDVSHLLGPALLHSPETVATRTARVSLQALETYLQAQAHRDRLCRSVPFVVLYFVMFDVMLVMHESLSDASQVERSLRDMMTGSSFQGYEEGPAGSLPLSVSGHKVLQDLDGQEDFYTYLREAIIPAILPFEPGGDVVDLGRLFRYNRLLGGLQLEQTRTSKQSCASLYPNLGPFNDLKVNPLIDGVQCYRTSRPDDAQCFGPGAAAEGFCKSPGSQGRRLRRVRGFEEEVLPSVAARAERPIVGPRYSLIMHEFQGTSVALKRLEGLVSGNWIDEQTTWVGMKFFTVNPDAGIYGCTRVNIFFTENGQVTPRVQVVTFRAEPYQDKTTAVADALWIALLIHFIASRLWGLVRVLRKRRLWSLYFRNPWTWINWLCAVMGLVVVPLWVAYLAKLDSVKESSIGVATSRPPAGSSVSTGSEVIRTYTAAVETLHGDVSDVESYLSFFRFFLGCYNILLVARFFEVFQAQPRIALVTETLLQCLPDFLHFMIVFVTMLIAFAVMGTFLFGHRLPEYSSVGWSVERCLLMILAVDYEDYWRLSEEHPFTTMLWFVSFAVLMYLIMLNMSLAIIIDVYSGLFSAFSSKESLPMQVLRTLRGGGLPAKKILEHLDDLPATISGPQLACVCPRLGEANAAKLVLAVAEAEEHTFRRVTSMTDATSLVLSLRSNVITVRDKVDTLVTSVNDTHTLLHRTLARAKPSASREPRPVLDSRARRRLKTVERRLGLFEGLLEDAMQYSEHRGKGFRDRLQVLEERLRDRSAGA